MSIAAKERSQRALFNDEPFSVFLDDYYKDLVKKLETSNKKTYVDDYISKLKEFYEYLPEIDTLNYEFKPYYEKNKICLVVHIKYKGEPLYFDKIPKNLKSFILGYIAEHDNEVCGVIIFEKKDKKDLLLPIDILAHIDSYVNNLCGAVLALRTELDDFIVQKEEELIKLTEDHNEQIRVMDKVRQIRSNIDKNKDSDFILVPNDKKELDELKKKIKSQAVQGKG